MFPVIETDRLILTDFEEGDEVSVFELFSNKQVVEYYDLNAFSAINQAEELICLFKDRYRKHLGIRWAVRLKECSSLMGSCGFNSWNTKMHSAGIGYDLNSIHWGKGYAYEANMAIIRVAFDGKLPCGMLNRIQADTVPGNVKSEKLLSRLGFKQEGIRRESGYWKGRYHDLKCFGLLKSEFIDEAKSTI